MSKLDTYTNTTEQTAKTDTQPTFIFPLPVLSFAFSLRVPVPVLVTRSPDVSRACETPPLARGPHEKITKHGRCGDWWGEGGAGSRFGALRWPTTRRRQ